MHALMRRKNVLTHDNYEIWSLKAEAELTEDDLWEAIKPGYPEQAAAVEGQDPPPPAMMPAQVKRNQKARAYLLNHVSDDILSDIKGFERAKDMWNSLAALHGRYTAIHVAMLIKELGKFEKTDQMTMHQYIAKIQDLCSKLASGGIKFSNFMIAVFMISCLPLSKYGPLVRSMRLDEQNLNLQDIKNKLFLEERSMKLDGAQNQECASTSNLPETPANALPAQQQKQEGYQKERGRGRGRGGGSRRRGGRGGPQNNNTNKDVKCFKCGEWGHMSFDCKEAEKFRAAQANLHPNSNNSLSGSGNNNHISAICTAGLAGFSATAEEVRDIWFLDSGASDPMTPDRSRFIEFHPYQGTVRIGRGSLPVEGRGKVELKLAEKCGGFSMTLSDCLFVPGLEMNLISVKKLAKKGINTLCTDEYALGLRATDNCEVFKAYPVGDVYALEMVPRSITAAWCQVSPACGGEASAMALRSARKPWHERLGHVHEAAMRKLPGLEDAKTKSKVCDVCAQGKLTKVSTTIKKIDDYIVKWAIDNSVHQFVTDWISFGVIQAVFESVGLGA